MIILPSSAGIYRPVSSGFNPNSISNRLFWLSQGVGMLDSSNNPVTTSGSTVTTWQDQTGNGNHFTGQATYLDATNAGNGNGQGVISHNNTSDYFARNISLTADFTIFVVQKPTSSLGLPFYDGAYYLGAYEQSSALINNNLLGTVRYRQNGLNAGIPNRNDLYAINHNKFKLLTIEGTGVTDYASSTQLRLWDYPGYRQGGQTAEVFWVSRAVTTTERANLENYFMSKYGIVAPYTSLPVSGAALWLDGSRLDSLYTTDSGSTNVSTNGGAIGRWEDLSGNARHATQATAGSRPTWSSPANGLNGLGMASFNGSNQRLTMSLPSLASGYTIYTVLRTPSSYAVMFASAGNGLTNATAALYWEPSKIGISQWGAAALSNVAGNTFIGTVAKYDGVHPSGGFRIRTTNQTADITATMTQNTGTPAAGIGAIGSDTQGTPSGYFAGPVCELILFDSQRSTSDDTAIKNYFANKWNLTWL